jgi:hypothetical protein
MPDRPQRYRITLEVLLSNRSGYEELRKRTQSFSRELEDEGLMLITSGKTYEMVWVQADYLAIEKAPK